MIKKSIIVTLLASSLSFGVSNVFASSIDQNTVNTQNQSTNAQKWIGAWIASPQPAYEDGISHDGFKYQTIRMIVHPQATGSALRLRFSNTFGSQPLTLGRVDVALATGKQAVTESGSHHDVTFGGKPTITIPPGAEVLSDPVSFEIIDDADLAVSVYVPGQTGPTTWHKLSRQNSYITTEGDYTKSDSSPSYSNKIDSWFWLDGVDVLSSDNNARVIVTLGDSITDGYASTVDANHRWPNYFYERLKKEYPDQTFSVMDAGISGNKILRDSPIYGVNALARLTRDVLSQTGVTDVILLEGINDIGHLPHTLDADKIIAGMQQIAYQTHAKGLRIYVGTLTPFRGFRANYFTEEGEKARKKVNEWIRTSGVFDGVIDFEHAVADPANPEKILPNFDFDHLHPNDAGYKAMADSIDLSIFKK